MALMMIGGFFIKDWELFVRMLPQAVAEPSVLSSSVCHQLVETAENLS